MRLRNCFITQAFLIAALASLITSASITHAQQPSQKKPANGDEDVLRIKTELVQTDVMVFDKRGRFVEGLRPEQFELSVDGKRQPVAFFERITSGSASEAAQLAAARGVPKQSEQGKAQSTDATVRGRTIFFFLDDLHLSESSLMRARKALTEFINNRMGQDDQVAIVSTSGEIGFLQQLTDNKAVLLRAASRLSFHRNSIADDSKVPISENDANQVQNVHDRELFWYLVRSTQNEYQMGVESAVQMVKSRVRLINIQGKTDAQDTLGVLQGLMRSTAALPGRKLVIYLSDGFISDNRRANTLELMRNVTDEAARLGCVVYTMDLRGTFSDPAIDATREDYPDLSSPKIARNLMQEEKATREPLYTLAEDTGGRAIVNSNSITDYIEQALSETNDYYLLVWRPGTDEQRIGKSRIKVSIKDQPELRVRLRRNYYVAPPRASAKDTVGASERGAPAATESAAKTPDDGLLPALASLYPRREIPTALSVGYVNTSDKGLLLKASMQIDRASLDLATSEAKKTELDVIGAAVDDRGIIVTFKQLLTVTADPTAQNLQQAVVWNQQLNVKPGLYQVRVAVSERSTGRTGSAQAWIEVPDITDGRFQISSLFLGERKMSQADAKFATAPQPVLVDVDHHFARSSVLRFQTYIYNAAHSASATPDVEIQARVLQRDNRPAITMPTTRLPTDTTKDLARLPYWAEVALDQLPAGKYLLQVTATDKATKSVMSQQVSFIIE